MPKDNPEPRETAVLPRNFTITTAERMRALAAGPPAYSRRLRRIEDLQAAIVRSIVEEDAKGEGQIDPSALPTAIERDLGRLNQLIDDHNRYYPIEASLRIDLRTRRLMDWGEPWVPMPKVTIEVLLATARGISTRG
ncbi:MAG: hypothetical protein QM820_16900 [Minicystis sp.]